MNRLNLTHKTFGVCVIAGLFGATLSAPVIADHTFVNSRFALARHNPNGSLDTTFGVGGKVVTNFSSSSSEGANAVAIQTNGKIVVAGYAMGDRSQFALARYNANGSLDDTFDGDGKVLTNFASSIYEEANAVGIQSNGKIVVAGTARVGGGWQFALARYNSNGSLDATFSGDGIVLTNFASSTNEKATALVIHPDGRIVVAGHAYVNGVEQFALARYSPTGGLDTTFDGDGKVLTGFAYENVQANAVDFNPQGKIVVAGRSLSGRFALARYNPNGSLDSTFSSDGKVLTNFSSRSAVARAVIMTGDKANVAGFASSLTGADTRFALARYNPTGSLDITFDGDGRVLTNFASSTDERAMAIDIAAGQKSVVGGYATVSNRLQFALARYNPTGSLDITFDGDGKVLTNLSTLNEGATAVAIDGSGRTVAAGFGADNRAPGPD